MALWKQDSIEITGNDALELTGDAIVYDDLVFDVNAVKEVSGKEPTYTAYSAGGVWAFHDEGVEGNERAVEFNVQVPHTYAEGEDIYFHVHWVPQTADTAGVTWKLNYEWVNINGVYSSASSIEDTQAISSNAGKHFATDIGTLTGSGKTISSVIICRLIRHSTDNGDTFDDDAYFISADFHIPINTFGSRTEWVK